MCNFSICFMFNLKCRIWSWNLMKHQFLECHDDSMLFLILVFLISVIGNLYWKLCVAFSTSLILVLVLTCLCSDSYISSCHHFQVTHLRYNCDFIEKSKILHYYNVQRFYIVRNINKRTMRHSVTTVHIDRQQIRCLTLSFPPKK